MNQPLRLNLQDLRRSYQQGGLNEADMDPNPFAQFAKWFTQAEKAEILEPNAMIIATVNGDGQPSTRTVLLKYFDEDGFVFFTNYASQKSQDIAQNPRVALQFLWLDLERQIKILGQAEKISTAESMQYFFSRPKGSQIGAWVSHQSSIISSKDLLKMQFEKLKQKFAEGKVPFPDFWGGYRVRPHQMEFWQGGENRLHDRILYSQDSQTKFWKISRLAP